MKSAIPVLFSVFVAWAAVDVAAGVGDVELRGGYAVVVSASTRADAQWEAVVEELAAKHRCEVIEYRDSVDETLPVLRRGFPRYVAFVARPEEVTRVLVVNVHRLARQLDEDPYTDFFWGIVTGYDAANALRIVRQSEPLAIRKVASGTELAMDMVEEGVWFCELNRNKMVKKEQDGEAVQLQGPDDTTALLVQSLNEYQADLFVTSGHATEHDWQIGFRYRNGYFKHADGVLFGEDTGGNKFPVRSANPKVYLPIGNCLMGHIDQRDCMATSWMNSAGVCQMLGYIQPTWYGYMGWGVLDYFVEQPGRYTFTEAFFANHHALIHRLATFFPELVNAEADERGRSEVSPVLGERAQAAGLRLNDGRGLLFDRDMVVFYGDPAWQARLVDRPKAFRQCLEVESGGYSFEIVPQRGTKSFEPINRNGSQRGGRPFLAHLPHRVKDVRIVEGADLDPVITDDFILVPNPVDCDPSRTYRVRFRATPIR